jgi:hypothetical protein
MNVNVGVWVKTVMLLYVQADCSVIKGLMHVGCSQKAYWKLYLPNDPG